MCLSHNPAGNPFEKPQFLRLLDGLAIALLRPQGDAAVKRINRSLVYGLAMMALLASGCQTASQTPRVGLDNNAFMSLWQTYSHCRLSSDVGEAQYDMLKLTEASSLRHGTDGFVLPLPKKLDQLVKNPTNRFAVDVRAMASACSLHAGQLALEKGERDLARDLFATVLTLHAEEESSYYLIQAKTILSGLDRGFDVSLTTP
jgi:hypothetical protein